jgi:hypothetical protein
VGYAFATLAYVAAVGALIVGTYRALVECWVARLLSAPIALASGWVNVLVFVLIGAVQFVPAARGG